MREHRMGVTVSGALLALLLALPATTNLWEGLAGRPGHGVVDGEVGPRIDPNGITALPKGEVGARIDPNG